MLNKDQLADDHFIHTIIEGDLKSGKHIAIQTRFPPEPDGYLHIGHAKSICLNFGLAYIYDGLCSLCFGDTNPGKENDGYVGVIREDVEWLGFHWAGEPHFASNYLNQLYDYAVGLIKDGKAYVDDSTPEEIREYHGTLTRADKNSPYHDRNIEENPDLFTRMKNGEFPDGSKTLHLRVDVTSGNINMRDPVIYRIRRAHHHSTGGKRCVYLIYDYTHCVSGVIEGATHSLCTLEFEAHHPLYDWILDNIPAPHTTRPRQYEFSHLELLYPITSKRKLNQLVLDGHVTGWSDPRTPTISGIHRCGYTPEGLHLFTKRAGISKSESVVDMSVLEDAIREELENSTPRPMAVLNSLKVILTNFEAGKTQGRRTAFHPNHEEMGDYEVPVSQTIYIEADDFAENPPRGFKRLIPGGGVRLRHGYVIKCDEVVKDEAGNVVGLKCSIDHDTLNKDPKGRKIRGVIHWASAEYVTEIKVRLYDRPFAVERPDAVRGEDGEYLSLTDFPDPESIREVTTYAEPVAKDLPAENRWQFGRIGCFVTDRKDHNRDTPVFNRTVTLKDSWRTR